MKNMPRTSAPPRLVEVFPEFALELEELLIRANRAELAAQIPELSIARRCRCEDDFCATFHTQHERERRSGRDFGHLELQPKAGMIILDIVSGHIAEVEVLYRDDVRRALHAVFP
ncbi:MAG: hypothetical protein WBE76_29470 [Terracidiphilus sp.]